MQPSQMPDNIPNDIIGHIGDIHKELFPGKEITEQSLWATVFHIVRGHKLFFIIEKAKRRKRKRSRLPRI